MLSVVINLKEDWRLASGVSERRFNPLFKRSLKDGVLFWHRNFARSHFLRSAYDWYGDAYSRFKRKKTGMPLVQSGAFRHRMLAPRTLADVKGTSNGVRMTMAWGRPLKMKGKTLTAWLEAYQAAHPRATKAEVFRTVIDQAMSDQEAFMARRVLSFVKEGWPIRKAQMHIYSQIGYPEEMKEAFQEMMSATNDREEARIVQHISEFLSAELNKGGAAASRRIGG